MQDIPNVAPAPPARHTPDAPVGGDPRTAGAPSAVSGAGEASCAGDVSAVSAISGASQGGAPPEVVVELFGMLRLAAGQRDVPLPWRPGLTLGMVPALLAAACPALAARVSDASGALSAGLVFNVNGRDFVRDPATTLAQGDRLLLLSADPGG